MLKRTLISIKIKCKMSESDNEIENAAAALLMAGALLITSSKRKIRPKKSRKWLQRREEGKGILHMLNEELLLQDPMSYCNYLRMNNDAFEILLKLIENDISKQNTFLRDSVPARSRLQITLRFLATGETYRSLMYATRVHESTISRFVPEVCQAIIKNLKTTYLKTPTSEGEWEEIANQFYSRWDFRNCIGALDGKHIEFKAPQSSGSYFFNYKRSHSIVLLALVDARYQFLYVNIGTNGRVSDGGVFRESFLSKAVADNLLNFPPAKALPGRAMKVPYVIVADDAFPLCERILKPYSSRQLSHECRIFNYRLSRARRMVESAFGILANRFRVFLAPINLCVQKVEQITLCCVILHNFLTKENLAYAITENIGESNLKSLSNRQSGNRSSNLARNVRDEFKEFFTSTGSREWQDAQVAQNNM